MIIFDNLILWIVPLVILFYFICFLIFICPSLRKKIKGCLPPTCLAKFDSGAFQESVRTFLPPAFFTLLIAYAVFGKVNYIEEKLKIDLLAEPCVNSLDRGNGKQYCLDFAKLISVHKDNFYLNKYMIVQVEKIYAKVYKMGSETPIYRGNHKDTNGNDILIREEVNNLNLSNIYDHLGHSFWRSRMAACYLLSGINNDLINKPLSEIKWKDILGKLVNLIKDKNEEFEVRLMAQMTYARLTNLGVHLTEDVFGFDWLVKDWDKNSDIIIKRLEKEK